MKCGQTTSGQSGSQRESLWLRPIFVEATAACQTAAAPYELASGHERAHSSRYWCKTVTCNLQLIQRKNQDVMIVMMNMTKKIILIATLKN